MVSSERDGSCGAVRFRRFGWWNRRTGRVTGRVGDNALECVGDGPGENHEVQPERPVLDVGVVEAGPVVDRGVTGQPVDLAPAGQAGLPPEPGGVARYLLLEPVGAVGALGPRP